MTKRPFEIVLFSTLFPHKGEPTLGIFVENRLRQLVAQENIAVTVIAPVPWFPFKTRLFGKYSRMARANDTEVREGITIYHPRYFILPKIGMNLTPSFMYWAALSCFRRLLAKGKKIDLIDAHYLYPDGVAAGRIASRLDIPLILTARGSDVTEIAKLKQPKKMIIQAIDKAFHVITVSNNLRRDLVEMGVDGAKISTLRNGVDLVKFSPSSSSEVSRRWGPGPVLLFSGWLIDRKRVDLFLEVAALIPGLTAVVVGDGPLKSGLQAMAKTLGIEKRVIFHGQVSPEEMPDIYRAADVLLLPSDREGWANVLLESMACGTPVVTRAIGGAPDFITDRAAGIVVDSAKPEDLSEAVLDLIENPPGQTNTRAFAENFDWRSTSKGQMKIFEAAIENDLTMLSRD